ncbi:hypothetical protein BC827DRAFT_1158386 [Russula dissimulans]|nr:hypothetical protein BC827DRAFT_1158386 [Russula dissimulans]
MHSPSTSAGEIDELNWYCNWSTRNLENASGDTTGNHYTTGKKPAREEAKTKCILTIKPVGWRKQKDYRAASPGRAVATVREGEKKKNTGTCPALLRKDAVIGASATRGQSWWRGGVGRLTAGNARRASFDLPASHDPAHALLDIQILTGNFDYS